MKKGITGIMLAMMAISIVSFVPNFANADVQTQGKWVRMIGNINQWNETDGNTTSAFGSIVANAAIVNKNGTTDEWAMVNAIWSDTGRPSPPGGPHPLGGFNVSDTVVTNSSQTFSFYTARLLNLTELSFNSTETGHDFYLKGLWNVSQITETINITWIEVTFNGTIGGWGEEPINITRTVYVPQMNVTWTEEPFATNANGTLVADWGAVWSPGSGEMPPPIAVGTFELSIDGVGTLSGFASKSFMWAQELNICDFDGQGKVDISDLVKVARIYGEAPGFQNYDLSLDVNCEGRIGIGDLTTIAANIQG